MYKQRNLEVDYRDRMLWSEDKQPVLCPVSPTSGGARLGCTPACAAYEVVEHEAFAAHVSGEIREFPGRTEVVCKMGGFIIGLLKTPEPPKEG
jgi:hypothetical protein